MKKATAFLHGTYRRADLPFYRSLCEGRTTLAVDGGYKFFRLTGLYPDILLGDFDSLGRMPRDLPGRVLVKNYPVRKDKTDAHLALEYCHEQGARSIDLVMPGCGEIDHALGALFLLGLKSLTSGGRTCPRVRIISPEFEVRLVADAAASFRDAVGDIVSVLPLSDHITLSCQGTEYRADGVRLEFGDSRGLRNRVTARRASFRIMGKGLLIHHFGSHR